MSSRFSLLALSLILISSSSAAAEPQGSKIRIGFILPLTGDTATFGDGVRKGSELAFQALPEALRDSFEVYYEDDGFAPARTVSAYQSLRERRGIDVVVTAGSNTSKALAPIIERDKVPLLALASDPAVVESRFYANNFWVTPREEVKALLPEAERRGYKTAARFSTIHAFPDAIRKELDHQNKTISLALDEQFPPDAVDFRASVARLRAMRSIDAVFLILLPPQLGIFAKQAREHGITAPFVGFEFVEDPREIEAAKGGLEGCWFVNAAYPDPAFVTKYEQAFPGASQFAAGNGHDAVVLIETALRSNARTREQLAKFFRSAKDINGAMGRFSAAGDGTFVLPAALKVVKGSGFETLVGGESVR